MPDKTAVMKLATEIEAYLLAHPRAADTQEGIASWWLTTQRNPPEPEDLKEALEWLIGRGSVVKSALSDGRSIYTGAAK